MNELYITRLYNYFNKFVLYYPKGQTKVVQLVKLI